MMTHEPNSNDINPPLHESSEQVPAAENPPAAVEIGGRAGLEPTRYGDWEKNGRCIDF